MQLQATNYRVCQRMSLLLHHGQLHQCSETGSMLSYPMCKHYQIFTSSMLDSPATLPVSTRVLNGRVAGLSSKSNILWTRVSQMNVTPPHIGGLYVRHMSMCEACVLQVMCFQVNTGIQWIRDGSGIQTLVHVTFAR
jgi:hypothetical protein